MIITYIITDIRVVYSISHKINKYISIEMEYYIAIILYGIYRVTFFWIHLQCTLVQFNHCLHIEYMCRILPEMVRERRKSAEAQAQVSSQGENSSGIGCADPEESDAEFAARVQRAIASALGVKPLALSYTQVLDLEHLPHPAFLNEPPKRARRGRFPLLFVLLLTVL